MRDDRVHFEFLVLEAAQAGLSWWTILRKREGYRRAFADFDATKVARFTPRTVERLMQDASIVRNRQKIEAAIANARGFLAIQKEFGTFDRYVWEFVGGKPIVNRWRKQGDVPPTSKESDALSKDLKGRGFKFVGSTIIYAHMQATGLVNDHLVGCFRYRESSAGRRALRRHDVDDRRVVEPVRRRVRDRAEIARARHRAPTTAAASRRGRRSRPSSAPSRSSCRRRRSAERPREQRIVRAGPAGDLIRLEAVHEQHVRARSRMRNVDLLVRRHAVALRELRALVQARAIEQEQIEIVLPVRELVEQRDAQQQLIRRHRQRRAASRRCLRGT